MRDLVTSFWIKLLKKAGATALHSVAHELFIWLLNKWASFGNAVVPLDLRLQLSQFSLEFKDAPESEVGDKSVFAKAWESSLNDCDASDRVMQFMLIRKEYERLLKEVPADKAKKWKQRMNIEL